MSDEIYIPTDNLRLFLTFLDGLGQVKILAATNQIDSQLRLMGVLEGKEQMLDLLDKAGISHYIIRTGDPLSSNFKATAYELSPKLLVNEIEKRFQAGDEILIKILEGGQLTEDERSFTPPTSLHVCASSVKTDDGLKRVQEWV